MKEVSISKRKNSRASDMHNYAFYVGIYTTIRISIQSLTVPHVGTRMNNVVQSRGH